MESLALKACTIDLRALRVVRTDGAALALSAREADVLRYLADRPGRAVDRDTLYAEVWGYRHAVLSRAVDALLRRLRAKIEADPSAPDHLLTVHGEGYRFEPGPVEVAAPTPGAATYLVAVGRDPLEEADPSVVSDWMDRIDRQARAAGAAAVSRSANEGVWSFGAPATAVGFCLAAVDAGSRVGARGAADGELVNLRRMSAATSPGRVLVTDQLYIEVATASTIRDRPWRRLGGVRLTWDGPPARLVETGGSDAEPGLRSAEGNLAPPPNRTIARELERAEALERLGHARVLTITGTGGVGKTRLATEIGLAWRTSGGGAWFCDLSACRTGREVEAVVARSLDLTGGPSSLSHLEGDLVVLDNAEQALEPVRTAVERWLGDARGPRWVITSRERLGLAAEEVQELRPLSGSDGAALYAERCRALGLEVGDPAAIEALVARVDGLPLALELAAGRSEVVSPTQIVAHLDRSLSALGRDETRPARHVDLRATVRWSWDLLDPREQEVLAACSTFAAPFEPASAVAVVGGDEDRVLEALHGLRRKGLLSSVPADPGPRRLALYAAVSAFAAEQLDPEATLAARDRHARWFARWGTRESLDALWKTDGSVRSWRMRADAPDLAAGFAHAGSRDPDAASGLFFALLSVEASQPDLVEERARIVLGFGRETVRVQMARAHEAASTAVLLEVDQALAEVGDDPRALATRAYIAIRLGRHDQAMPLIDGAIDGLRRAGDPYLVKALYSRALLLDRAGRYRDQNEVLTEIFALVRQRGDRKGECMARQRRSVVASTRGDLDRALEDAQAARALADELRSPELRSSTSYGMARIHLERDEAAPAFRAADASLREARGIAWLRGIDRSVLLLAVLAAEYRSAEESRHWVGVGRQGERDAGWAREPVLDGWLGEAALAERDFPQAIALLGQAIDAALATAGLPFARTFQVARAMARSAVGDPTGARADVEQALAGAVADEVGPSGWARMLSERAVIRAEAGDRSGAEADLVIASAAVSPARRLVGLKVEVCRGLVALAGGDRAGAAEIAGRLRADLDRRGLGPTTRVGGRLAVLEAKLVGG